MSKQIYQGVFYLMSSTSHLSQGLLGLPDDVFLGLAPYYCDWNVDGMVFDG